MSTERSDRLWLAFERLKNEANDTIAISNAPSALVEANPKLKLEDVKEQLKALSEEFNDEGLNYPTFASLSDALGKKQYILDRPYGDELENFLQNVFWMTADEVQDILVAFDSIADPREGVVPGSRFAELLSIYDLPKHAATPYLEFGQWEDDEIPIRASNYVQVVSLNKLLSFLTSEDVDIIMKYFPGAKERCTAGELKTMNEEMGRKEPFSGEMSGRKDETDEYDLNMTFQIFARQRVIEKHEESMEIGHEEEEMNTSSIHGPISREQTGNEEPPLDIDFLLSLVNDIVKDIEAALSADNGEILASTYVLSGFELGEIANKYAHCATDSCGCPVSKLDQFIPDSIITADLPPELDFLTINDIVILVLLDRVLKDVQFLDRKEKESPENGQENIPRNAARGEKHFSKDQLLKLAEELSNLLNSEEDVAEDVAEVVQHEERDDEKVSLIRRTVFIDRRLVFALGRNRIQQKIDETYIEELFEEYLKELTSQAFVDMLKLMGVQDTISVAYAQSPPATFEAFSHIFPEILELALTFDQWENTTFWMSDEEFDEMFKQVETQKAEEYLTERGINGMDLPAWNERLYDRFELIMEVFHRLTVHVLHSVIHPDTMRKLQEEFRKKKKGGAAAAALPEDDAEDRSSSMDSEGGVREGEEEGVTSLEEVDAILNSVNCAMTAEDAELVTEYLTTRKSPFLFHDALNFIARQSVRARYIYHCAKENEGDSDAKQAFDFFADKDTGRLSVRCIRDAFGSLEIPLSANELFFIEKSAKEMNNSSIHFQTFVDLIREKIGDTPPHSPAVTPRTNTKQQQASSHMDPGTPAKKGAGTGGAGGARPIAEAGTTRSSSSSSKHFRGETAEDGAYYDQHVSPSSRTLERSSCESRQPRSIDGEIANQRVKEYHKEQLSARRSGAKNAKKGKSKLKLYFYIPLMIWVAASAIGWILYRYSNASRDQLDL